MASHASYLRADLPDGHADKLLTLAETLDEGATILRSDSQSRDQADRYNAAIDANRLMRKAAEALRGLAKPRRIPG